MKYFLINGVVTLSLLMHAVAIAEPIPAPLMSLEPVPVMSMQPVPAPVEKIPPGICLTVTTGQQMTCRDFQGVDDVVKMKCDFIVILNPSAQDRTCAGLYESYYSDGVAHVSFGDGVMLKVNPFTPLNAYATATLLDSDQTELVLGNDPKALCEMVISLIDSIGVAPASPFTHSVVLYSTVGEKGGFCGVSVRQAARLDDKVTPTGKQDDFVFGSLDKDGCTALHACLRESKHKGIVSDF